MNNRKNQCFHAVNDGVGFEDRGDGNLGITIKILSSYLDTTAKRGKRTGLLRDAVKPEAHAHDYWEEVYSRRRDDRP